MLWNRDPSGLSSVIIIIAGYNWVPVTGHKLLGAKHTMFNIVP